MSSRTPEKQVNLTILCADADQYVELLIAENPRGVNIIQASNNVKDIKLEDVECLLASPSLAAQILDGCPNLHWCQSTWAGNAPLLNHPRQDYCLTGVKGVFGQQMREYVFTYLFHFARNVSGFADLQNKNQWSPPPYDYLADKTLGVLGAGSIARALIAPPPPST